MPQITYNLHLKGFVGSADFDCNYVDYILDKYKGKPVNVLIDSLGGSVATALSIASAFRNHADVSVHFVGMNASAATIASLGARHISIDANAMYLVHKCSSSFFEWGSLNADQFADLISNCEKIKADLDKLDLNIASMYSGKCKKNPKDLLDLMQKGGWLSAKDALDWGFVDEITDLPEEVAPTLTDAVASEMAVAGLPIPNVPFIENSDLEIENGSAQIPISKFQIPIITKLITSLFKNNNNNVSTAMNKTYSFICSLLGINAVALTDNVASLSDEQLTAIDNHIAELGKQIEDSEKTISDLKAQIDVLKASPGDGSKQVVDDGSQNTTANPITDYCKRVADASAMYNALP